MQIDIADFEGNIYNFLRKVGYHPDRVLRKEEPSFSRPLLGKKYPRFHIYYIAKKGLLNLHLDQKASKYNYAPDHGAEYEGRLVEEEGVRIKNLLKDHQS